MLDFDGSSLRARLIADYQSMAHTITDAREMDLFVDAVMTNAIRTVREVLNESHHRDALRRIPPAILASCFGHLSFPERLSPSHVCWSWREAALTHPALWCQIKPLSPCKRPELLEMALSRAGALPVDIDVDSRPPTAPEDMYSAIAPFSRQLRSLFWHGEKANLPWDFPAPKLEVFCYHDTLTITDQFFDGHIGRLRRLYLGNVHLPAECPILATVSELSLELTPSDGRAPSTIANLFGIFPGLVFLNIRGITRGASHLLPAGRAPETLRELWLSSRTLNHDLMPHILSWDSGNFHHIALRQGYDTRPDLEYLANGTVTLAVSHTGNDSTTSITFKQSATVCHTVELPLIGISNAAALLAAVQPSLRNVQCAMVSHVTLKHLATVLAALPALKHLFVHIVPKPQRSRSGQGFLPGRPTPREFDWRSLSHIADLSRRIPSLSAITLHVWCDDRHAPCSTNTGAARRLLAQLRALPADLPPIEIQGFDADAIASVDLTGLNVRFNNDAEVGPLRLWKQYEAYDPFP